MATKATTVKTVIQLRRDTTENWYLFRDVVPAAGEPCFDIELGTLKIGDGVKSYGELEIIGGGSIAVTADGTSIVLEDGVFKLTGFDVAEVGAQPRKNAEGNIEWIVPSTETAEGLQSTVAGLQSDVKALQDIITPSEEGAQPLLDRVETLEGKVDVLNGNEYTDGSVLKIVKDEINAFATDVNNNETVDTFKELVEYVANHNGEAATLAADILTLQELVGEDPVAEQIATAISNANGIETIKVGDTLIEAIDKIVTIPVGAGLTASEEVTISEDGTLGVGAISVSKLINDDSSILVLDGGNAN
jgi:hypothetical protein